MWHPAKQTEAPTAEPVTVAEVKSQSYIDHDDHDAQIALLIAAARDHIERYCNITALTQTIEAKCDCFDDFAYLPFAPVQSISSITYIDTDGSEQTLSSSVYELRADDLEGSIVLQYGQSWPARRVNTRITVTAVVGYTTVPPAIKHAMLLLVALGFENREAQELGTFSTADALLSNFRRYAA